MTPESATALRDAMTATMRNESNTTKKVLAAVPEDKLDYQHDPKGQTAGKLAWHIVESDVGFLTAVADLDFSKLSGGPEAPKTIKEMLDWYDERIGPALDRVDSMTPEQLVTKIQLAPGLNLPAVNYLTFNLVHAVHHRGQLSTYLRPMGSKVPSIYGPSADEEWKPNG